MHLMDKKLFRAAVFAAAFFMLAGVFPAASASVSADSKKVIIIGDSRAQEMHDVTGDAGCLWSYKIGSGYEWMVSEGVPAVEGSIGENSAVVIMLGVNDVIDSFRISMYADYINQKAAEWKELGAETFYVSILPVDDSRSVTEHNVDIDYWNIRIQQLLSDDVIYMDVSGALGGNFGTVDGLHYTADTYQTIFDLTISGVDLYQPASVVFEPEELPPDDAVVPHMTVTAADTESVAESADTAARWVTIGEHIRYVDEDGKLATGLREIDGYICMFDKYGDLQWKKEKD